jgi:hypothetical protein
MTRPTTAGRAAATLAALLRASVLASVLALPQPSPVGRRGLLQAAAASSVAIRHPSPVAAFTAEDYERDPADISSAALPAFSEKHVFLHIHGRGGPDREDADLEARVRSQDAAAGLQRFVHVFVWREWLEAASTERISYTGQALGRKLGQSLALRDDLLSLHVCGTSAGAFAANECVSAYVAAAGAKRATTRLTLCDPFCARADEVGSPWDDGLSTSGARAREALRCPPVACAARHVAYRRPLAYGRPLAPLAERSCCEAARRAPLSSRGDLVTIS